MQVREDVLDAFAHVFAQVSVLTENHATLEHLAQVRVVGDDVGRLWVDLGDKIDQVEQ